MGKRMAGTPRSKIRAALRQLWLRSRERSAALKREGYCCERCKVKQSKAKGREVDINVHHREGIKWEDTIDYIAKNILCPPEQLEVLCVDCHDKEHQIKLEV